MHPIESQTLSQSNAPKDLSFIHGLVQDDMGRVDQLMFSLLENPVSSIPQIGFHLLRSGGKRIRPVLLLLVSKMCGHGLGDKAIAYAACIEFIHAATLLHDDVLDESLLRRGKETSNARWGNHISILMGDFLFAQAFKLMVQQGSLDILDVLSQASAQIVQGEMHQVELVGRLSMDQRDYLEMIESKTPPLFEAAALVGGLLGGRDSHHLEDLRTYGHALGMIFQLQDDWLDFHANAKDLGKNPGDDFKEGKITLPVLMAHGLGTPSEKAFWQRTLVEKQQRPQDFQQALDYMVKHDIKGKMENFIDTFAQKGLAALNGFEGPYCQALRDLMAYCAQRKS